MAKWSPWLPSVAFFQSASLLYCYSLLIPVGASKPDSSTLAGRACSTTRTTNNRYFTLLTYLVYVEAIESFKDTTQLELTPKSISPWKEPHQHLVFVAELCLWPAFKLPH